MKQIRALAALFLCCLILFIPASALSGVSISGNCSVGSDGSCQVELTLSISLGSTESDLTFPLPAEATHVTLSGLPAQTRSEGGKLLVTLPSLPAGQHALVLAYRLPGLVSTTKSGEALLTLPLLSGFRLPIDALTVCVTLPGEITAEPTFISGYHLDNIRVDTTVSGNTLTASLTQSLKDHDTLVMTLAVDETPFYEALEHRSSMSRWDWAAFGLVCLALLYYLLTLLPKFSRRKRSFTAPEGVTAGEVGACLTGCGTDLNMMALSWAQLGYIQIEVDRKHRVLLHKRMEMGNERSYHEGRIFQILFSRRTTVDATAPHYVRLYRKVSGRSPLLKQLFKPRSGDLRIFRALCCAAAACCGAQMGMGSVFLAIVMALLCAVAALCIHIGCKCIPLRSKLPLAAAIGCSVLWVLLGAFAGTLARVVLMVLFQFLSGVCAAYGGKRSELGQRTLSQILGLRQHMVGANPFDIQLLQQKNPNYFYEMAPYALAMGVDRQFAKKFDSKQTLPECGWLKDAPSMTAAQCAVRLRRISDTLDRARYRRQ